MNRQQFSEFRDQHYDAIAAINAKKGKDYAGDDDALANFKAAAEAFGMTPFQVWAVYHHKHQSAIDSFIKNGQVESEPIEGRIHDAILYLFLLLGLIEDEKPADPTRGMGPFPVLAEDIEQPIRYVDPPDSTSPIYHETGPRGRHLFDPDESGLCKMCRYSL
jgi:hypothetical protein